MRTIAFVLLALSLPTASNAQFVDSQHRKDWFYLQKLSEDIHFLSGCISSENFKTAQKGGKGVGDEIWRFYYGLQADLAEEIENYVVKYVGSRGGLETPKSFRYRVWDVSLTVGRKRAEQRGDSGCEIAMRAAAMGLK
jgi:hypothetical protein